MSFYLVKYKLRPENYIVHQEKNSWRWHGEIYITYNQFTSTWFDGDFSDSCNLLNMTIVKKYKTFKNLLANNFELFL